MRYTARREIPPNVQARESFDRGFHQPVTGFIVDVRDQTETTAVFFKAGLVEAG